MRINILRLIERGLDFVLAGIPTEVDILQKRLERLDELSKKLEEAETRKAIEEASKIEDVEAAIEHLKQAAKKLACPFCRARLIAEIEYLKTYDLKTKLLEEGVPPNEVDKEFERRGYDKSVKDVVNRLLKELKVSQMEFEQARKEVAKKIFGF